MPADTAAPLTDEEAVLREFCTRSEPEIAK